MCKYINIVSTQMSNFKTYCRIIDYLEATDPDLAQLVRGTCVDMTLGSTKGKPGVTLLIPDKDYRAKITKLAYSSDPDEASQACDMLNAIILRDVFKSGADFMAKRANIPNSLYPSQHVGVKDVKGNTVTFESGASATLDTKFADSSKKKNLAVWHLKGELPVTSDRPAKIERSMGRGAPGAKGSKSKAGGYDNATAIELSKNLRWRIAVAIENEYALSLLQSQTGGRSNPDPFVRCAMSLVEYLNDKAPDVLKAALPLLSLSKADFYFLVEPHRDGDYLVNDAFIENWWSSRATHSTGAGCKILDGLNSGNAKSLPDIDRARKELLQRCTDRKCVEHVEAAYRAKYGSEEEASLKLLQDELRFLIHCSFEELEAAPYDSGKFGEIVNMIGEYMHKMSGSAAERKAGNKIFNAATLKYSIAPSDKIETIKCFINSTYFMFTPLSIAEARAIPKSHTTMPGPSAKGLWNITAANQQKYSEHSRLLPNAELETLLKDVDAGLAEKIRAALKK